MLFHQCDSKAMPTGRSAKLGNNKGFLAEVQGVANNRELKPGQGVIVRGKSQGATYLALYSQQPRLTVDCLRATARQILVDADDFKCFVVVYYLPVDQATTELTAEHIIEGTMRFFSTFLEQSSVKKVYLVGGRTEHNAIIQRLARGEGRMTLDFGTKDVWEAPFISYKANLLRAKKSQGLDDKDEDSGDDHTGGSSSEVVSRVFTKPPRVPNHSGIASSSRKGEQRRSTKKIVIHVAEIMVKDDVGHVTAMELVRDKLVEEKVSVPGILADAMESGMEDWLFRLGEEKAECQRLIANATERRKEQAGNGPRWGR